MGRAILQTIGATICMEVVLLAVMYALRYHGIALQLSLAVPAAAVAYLLISWLLHIEMLGLLLGGRRTTAVVAWP